MFVIKVKVETVWKRNKLFPGTWNLLVIIVFNAADIFGTKVIYLAKIFDDTDQNSYKPNNSPTVPQTDKFYHNYESN